LSKPKNPNEEMPGAEDVSLNPGRGVTYERKARSKKSLGFPFQLVSERVKRGGYPSEGKSQGARGVLTDSRARKTVKEKEVKRLPTHCTYSLRNWVYRLGSKNERKPWLQVGEDRPEAMTIGGYIQASCEAGTHLTQWSCSLARKKYPIDRKKPTP